MCFRPAEAITGNSTVNKCASCGKTIQSMGGSALTTCPFCKQPLMDSIQPSVIRMTGNERPQTPGTPKPPA